LSILKPAMQIWSEWIENIMEAYPQGVQSVLPGALFEFKPEDSQEAFHEVHRRITSNARGELERYMGEMTKEELERWGDII